jgi:DNA-binding NarL/FixJ family response regulator
MATTAPQQPCRQLNLEEQGEIIGMWKCGVSFVAIALNLELKANTVQKVWNYYAKLGLIVTLVGLPT